jgi:hypothetical protein
MDDAAQLEQLNEQFIEAFRQGSWELLEPILGPCFSYLDGASGEVWEHERYVDNLRAWGSLIRSSLQIGGLRARG